MQNNFFSDETWFYLHGQVCSQNYWYYSDWKTERVSASIGSMMHREAAGRPGKATSDSRLLPRLIYKWLCIKYPNQLHTCWIVLLRIVNITFWESLGLKYAWEEGLILNWYLLLSDSMVVQQCIKLEIWGSNPSLDTNFSLSIYHIYRVIQPGLDKGQWKHETNPLHEVASLYINQLP